MFVDSSSPGQIAALRAALPPKEPGEPSLLTELRDPHEVALDNPEYLDWLELQKQLASLSARSVHVLARNSGHFVQQDAPDFVLAAVRAAVTAVRGDDRLGTCSAIFRQTSGRTCLR